MTEIKEAIKQLESLKEHCKSVQKIDDCADHTSHMEAIDTAVEMLPLIPVRHGRNITTEHPVDEFVCSECKIHLTDYVRVKTDEDSGDIAHCEYEIKYCPECGAKMEEVLTDEH